MADQHAPTCVPMIPKMQVTIAVVMAVVVTLADPWCHAGETWGSVGRSRITIPGDDGHSRNEHRSVQPLRNPHS
jgi:hypothetical protein